MLRRIWRHAFMAVAAITLLVTAQPVAAYKETGRTGITGAHSVVDTVDDAGATCIYTPGPASWFTLAHIVVYAPYAKGIPGMGTEKVGWNFTVQRRIQGQGWTNRLTSKTFTSYADSSHDAMFSGTTVRVIVPNPPETKTASYRVNIKMFWFGSNGSSVIGTATGRIEYYNVTKTTTTGGSLTHGSCFDYEI